MTKFNFKRKGTVTVSRQLIMKDPETVMKMFSEVLIIRAENCFVADDIIYYGYSKHFEEMPEGSIVPEYMVVVTSDADKISFKWLRK